MTPRCTADRARLPSSFSASSRLCSSRTCLSHVITVESSDNSSCVFVDYFDYFETVWLPSCPFELCIDSCSACRSSCSTIETGHLSIERKRRCKKLYIVYHPDEKFEKHKQASEKAQMSCIYFTGTGTKGTEIPIVVLSVQ